MAEKGRNAKTRVGQLKMASAPKEEGSDQEGGARGRVSEGRLNLPGEGAPLRRGN